MQADFLLPHLRPGMRLLDCGCGPGSITLGLAQAVAPGEVVGVDRGPAELEAARALAAERGVTNVRFQEANVYALPFPDASFDATFAHALLQHLRDPLAALREMRRVLKPGGVAGVSDVAWELSVREPSTSLLDQLNTLVERARQHNGGSPDYARHQRELLLRAGFARSEGSASVPRNGSGALERTRWHAAYQEIVLQDMVREVALAQGWADAATLDAMAAELRAWGERPDAFGFVVSCRALGWVGDATRS
jgi:SAM-dependent methyltransferase